VNQTLHYVPYFIQEQRTDLISKQLSSNSVIDEPTERGILSSCRNSSMTSKSRLKKMKVVKKQDGEEQG
jgi:predicted KAP-like P-loop ATPase